MAGLLADADVLIRSSSDPLLAIEYHRHFTHSLFFVPFGALIVTLLCWPLLRKKLSLHRLYYFSFLGYVLSGVLDAFTSYGTHLFWPLVDEPIAWYLISIIDPLFTGGLLLAVLWSLFKQQTRPTHIGLLFCGLYLCLSWLQSGQAEKEMFALAKERGHQVEKYTIKPTIGNIFLWRSIYHSGERYYVDAIRIGFLENQIYEGESAPSVDINATFAATLDPNSVLFKDIVRFQRFSNDYLALSPDDRNILGDVRYSMFPTSVRPLWGIIMNPEAPNEHASYEFFRKQDAASRRYYLQMVLGADSKQIKESMSPNKEK